MSNDIIDIKKIDFNNSAEVLGASEVIIAYDLFVEAYLLYAKLRELESESTRIITDDIIRKLKWVALPKFSEDEIVKMFGESFTTIFEIEYYDLLGKVKQKIVADIWYEDRDNFKKAIGKALLKNTELLTSQNIIINGKEEHPTVGNWLKDYNVNLGFAPVNVAKQSEYLTNSKNMKSVMDGIKNGEESRRNGALPRSEEGVEGCLSEKDKLKILFNFYEKLKLSSLTAEGLEEDIFIDEDGIKGILSGGVFEKIDPKIEQRLGELQKIIDSAISIKQENPAGKQASNGASNKTTKQEEQKLEIGPSNTAGKNWKLGNVEENRRDGALPRSEEGCRNGALPRSEAEKQKLEIKQFGKKEEARGDIFPKDTVTEKENGMGADDSKVIRAEAGGRGEAVPRKNPPQPPFTKGGSDHPPLEKEVDQQAKKAYIFSLDEQRLIKDNEYDIKRIARGNIILVGKELTSALEQKNRPRVIAALRMAVKNNLLIGWAGKDNRERIKNGNFGSGKLVEGQVVIKFLRRVLQDKLCLSESEAAKIGVHLYNLFRKLGRDIGYLAYYDEQEKTFRWMDID
ncbi:MAG: hypothetical protein V1891_04995 [bacterium]